MCHCHTAAVSSHNSHATNRFWFYGSERVKEICIIDPENWAYVPTLAINGTLFVIADNLCVEPCCHAATISHNSNATGLFWFHNVGERTKTS